MKSRKILHIINIVPSLTAYSNKWHLLMKQEVAMWDVATRSGTK